MLRKLYSKLPIPAHLRVWISKHLPDSIKRESHLRQFGVINDLYFWRTDSDIDTIAPIQNFFSALYPHLDTATTGHVWFYDNTGKLISDHQFKLPHLGFHELRISDYVPKNSYGTFMWNVSIPDSVASLTEVIDNKIYFTDRGYICFEKSGYQPSFMHGIDRYSVFQKQSKTDYQSFYNSKTDRTWVAEFPLDIQMQLKTEVILINRNKDPQTFKLSVYKNGDSKLLEKEIIISSRGAGLFCITQDELLALDSNQGYFTISGIPTPWGRPAIMRHFDNGAISAMHC